MMLRLDRSSSSVPPLKHRNPVRIATPCSLTASSSSYSSDVDDDDDDESYFASFRLASLSFETEEIGASSLLVKKGLQRVLHSAPSLEDLRHLDSCDTCISGNLCCLLVSSASASLSLDESLGGGGGSAVDAATTSCASQSSDTSNNNNHQNKLICLLDKPMGTQP